MRTMASTIPAALALTAAAAAGQTTVTHYQVVDLGVAPEHSNVCPCFFSTALNNPGAAAGFFFGADGTYNAFASTGGAMVDISPPGDNQAFARGMNDLGHVVGWTDFFAPQHGFLWDGDSLIDLGTLGGTYSEARDTNSTGQIVGSASTQGPEEESHAALWEDGSWTDLGTLGGPFSEALAINETGAIVGWSWDAAWDSKAVWWNVDMSGPFELPFLPGAEPEWISVANGLNDNGQIVGQVQVGAFEGSSLWRAVLWENGNAVDLGLLPEAGQGSNQFGQTAHVSTGAGGVNASGVIVGMSFPEATIPQLRPGPWVHRKGVMTNLNDLLAPGSESWIIRAVASINDSGVIAASAQTLDDTHSRAVLLVPVEVILGDVNNDGQVGVVDLLELLAQWGPCVGCSADLDHDGVVSISDFLLLLGNWTV